MRNIISKALLVIALTLFWGCSDDVDFYSSEVEVPTVGINDNELVLAGKNEKSKIFINANFWWKATVEYLSESTEQWVQLGKTDGYGNIEIDVTTTRNYSLTEDRTATIIIESNAEGTSFKKEFTVIQKASDPYIEITEVTNNGTYVIPLTSGEASLELMVNDKWTATSDKAWCKVITGGENGKIDFTLNFDLNETGEPRIATVVITTENNLKYTFTVSQSGVFDKAVLSVTKTPDLFKASWEGVVGASKYYIDVYNIQEQLVGSIDAGTETEWDLAADPIFATPVHAGYTKLIIRTLSENPSIFSESDPAESNSHFTSGKGTQADPYIIGDMESLMNITSANIVAVNKGAHYKLGFTPNLTSEFVPVCSPANGFKGIFDGDGITISNWNRIAHPDEQNYSSLFGGIAQEGKVGNIKFNNCNIRIELSPSAGSVSKTNNGFSFVAAVNNGEIHDISLTNCEVTTEAGASPVIVGTITGINNGKIISCKTSGGILSAASNRNSGDVFECGGIAGNNNGLIDKCYNDKTEIVGMSYVAGIAGSCSGSTITNSGTNAKVTGNYYFGGIGGYTAGNPSSFINCYFSGTLVMDEPAGQGRGAAYMGGIVGRMYRDNDKIENCFVSGDIIVGASSSSSNIRVGGLTSQVYRAGNIVKNSYFFGTIQIAGKADAGGIAGLMDNKASTVENCYSVGKITKVGSASGNIYDAFGSMPATPTVTNVYALSNGGQAFAPATNSNTTNSGTRSESDMQASASYSSWSGFSSVWEIKGGAYPYPTLKDNPHRGKGE